MKLELTYVKDNPDGSATFDLDYDDEAKQFMIQYAITNMIKEMIEREKENAKSSD
jgi:hypothetical protein